MTDEIPTQIIDLSDPHLPTIDRSCEKVQITIPDTLPFHITPQKEPEKMGGSCGDTEVLSILPIKTEAGRDMHPDDDSVKVLTESTNESPSSKSSGQPKRKSRSELQQEIKKLKYTVHQYQNELRMYRDKIHTIREEVHTTLLEGNRLRRWTDVELARGSLEPNPIPYRYTFRSDSRTPRSDRRPSDLEVARRINACPRNIRI